MRKNDLKKIKEIIMASGIGTKIQRAAICQRLDDWFESSKIAASRSEKTVDSP